jgi:hypothetical protein
VQPSNIKERKYEWMGQGRKEVGEEEEEVIVPQKMGRSCRLLVHTSFTLLYLLPQLTSALDGAALLYFFISRLFVVVISKGFLFDCCQCYHWVR